MPAKQTLFIVRSRSRSYEIVRSKDSGDITDCYLMHGSYLCMPWVHDTNEVEYKVKPKERFSANLI